MCFIQVVYTKTAMCELNLIRAGSECNAFDDTNPIHHLNIINLAETSVDYTNEAYRNSHINTQLRLVHVHYTTQNMADDSYYNCVDLVEALRSPNDGVMDDVHTVRDTVGADIVTLLGSGYVYGCQGQGYTGHFSDQYSYSDYMFSVGK